MAARIPVGAVLSMLQDELVTRIARREAVSRGLLRALSFSDGLRQVVDAQIARTARPMRAEIEALRSEVRALSARVAALDGADHPVAHSSRSASSSKADL